MQTFKSSSNQYISMNEQAAAIFSDAGIPKYNQIIDHAEVGNYVEKNTDQTKIE